VGARHRSVAARGRGNPTGGRTLRLPPGRKRPRAPTHTRRPDSCARGRAAALLHDLIQLQENPAAHKPSAAERSTRPTGARLVSSRPLGAARRARSSAAGRVWPGGHGGRVTSSLGPTPPGRKGRPGRQSQSAKATRAKAREATTYNLSSGSAAVIQSLVEWWWCADGLVWID
jgi:hypothetical protein